MIRVLIVDDQALVRTGFRLILELEDDIVVVGEARDGREALELARETAPDVALMDIRMPVLDGLEATRQIKELIPATRVLMLTTFDLDEYVFAAVKAGASGFLLKDVPREQLVLGIRMVAAGEALVAPSITRRLIERFVTLPGPTQAETALSSLTPREVDVLRLLGRGLSNTEIGVQLVIGEATVKTHVARIQQKMQLRDRIQTVVLAYESGLVIPGS